jgi:hypothetical protein
MLTTIRRRRLWPAILLLAALSGPLALAAGPAQAREDPPILPAMQVVVLVDESGSLSDADVVREREAARTIAFSVLAPSSELSVVGFGSSNGPGQSAVNVVCKPTVLDSEQDRDSLANCISGLQRRKPEQGADTDHAAALQQALSYVQAGKTEHKIVFLLTDGVLDVANSPAYGDTPERRNAAAKANAARTLDQLAAAKAQVWPLGFGSVDQAALKGFARGKSCTPAAGDPREQVVSDSSKLTAAVAEAFSSAGCVKYSPPDIGDLAKGGDKELHGVIPAIASEASILVYKRDKRVQVEYLAPGASKPAPDAGGSKFEFAGQSTDVETIKISDPQPGEWTIRLSSADVAAKDVTATVVYQAAVRTYLTVNPPQPVPGETVDVQMQVWARNRAITDAAALRGLSFVATMTGAGFGAQQVPLADTDGDGTISGKVTVPAAASGDLVVTGQVTGIGIGGDTRVLNTRVQAAGRAVQGSILFDVNRAAANPGTAIPGRITVKNDSGQPARLRLVVADPSPGTVLRADPAVLEVAPGSSTTPFTLTVGDDTVEGTSSATLRLVNDADPSAVVAERLFAAEVSPVPSIWYRYRWLLLAGAGLLVFALALLAFRLRAINDAKKVRGLTVRLYSAGAMSDELPGDPRSKVLRFTVNQDFTGPHLQPAAARDPEAYEVRRSGAGLVLTAPNTPRAPLGVGVQRRVGKDLSIAVLDAGRSGTTEPEPDGTGGFDPFHGAPATMPIPGAHADAASGQYPPAQDPFGPAHGDPFAAPTEPYRSEPYQAEPYRSEPYSSEPYRSEPHPSGFQPAESSGEPGRNSSHPPQDPNNPFS